MKLLLILFYTCRITKSLNMLFNEFEVAQGRRKHFMPALSAATTNSIICLENCYKTYINGVKST